MRIRDETLYHHPQPDLYLADDPVTCAASWVEHPGWPEALVLKVRFLGQFQIANENESIDIPSRPAQSLLAYLMMNAGRRDRREKLAGLLWPESNESNARSNLRHALWRLRNALGEDYFLADKMSIAFNPNADYKLDVDLLLSEPGVDSPIKELIQAVEVYGGELLPGFYDDWVTIERERLASIFERNAKILLERLLSEGKWKEAAKWAEHWLAHSRASESAFRALMNAHAGSDDLAAVSQTYRRCVTSLDEELGVEPSDETRELYERFSRGAKPASAAPYPTPIRRSNLPAPTTPFVGREKELATIYEALRDPACRLVSVSGPGGIGKTRLALEAARTQEQDFDQGVCFVPLAPISEAGFLIPGIAEALGFDFIAGEDPENQLIEYLREKSLLLVLDNFEHLLSSAGLIGRLLTGAPGIKALATTRERLNLQGEWLLILQGFSSQDGSDPAESSPVQLFLNAARRIQSSFQLQPEDLSAIHRITELVGGLPLGIELAAGWVRMLSPTEIAQEIESSIDFLTSNLRDLPERHRSLRAVFDYSWQLLLDEERTVFARLSVFRAGFSRQAAEAVAGLSLPMLSALADKSFLRRNEASRFEIHGMLKQYAYDQLRQDERGLKFALDQHAAFFAAYSEHWAPSLQGKRRGEALNAVCGEMENLRAAWNHSVQAQELGLVDRFVQSMWLAYDLRGWFQEGYEAFGRVADSLRAGSTKNVPEATQLLARVITRQAWFAWRLGRYREGRELARESFGLVENFEASETRAFSLNVLGVVAYALGDYRAAQNNLKQSLALWRAIDDRWGIAISLLNLSLVSHTLGDYGEARGPYEEGLELFKEIGYQSGATFSFDALGRLARSQGELNEALALSRESLAMRREMGDPWGIANALDSLAAVQCGLGEYDAARASCLESLAIRQSLGDRRGLGTAFGNLSIVEHLLGDETAALENGQRGLEIRRELGDRRGLAASNNHLGLIALQLNHLEDADRYANESLVIRRQLGDRAGEAAALHTLGLTALAAGNTQQAQRYLETAFGTAMQIGAIPLALDTLPGLANLLYQAGKAELAAEMLALAVHHPASSPDTQTRGREVLSTAAASGESEKLTRAWERGMTRSLEELAGELLHNRGG